MTPEIDRRFMQVALALGRRAAGETWPNPAVGCVIVKDGRVVGRGRTAPGGRPHAEPQALAQAGDTAVGATAYVSLEPCSHYGQTPPCVDALIGAGIARVVIAHGDPDPRVAGEGVEKLRAAGVEVTEDVCAEEAAVDHAGFFLRVTEGRPFVTLKLAQSLDGRIAMATGESQWITGPEARRAVHAMRARHDAVMVGAGTARTDDPSLTVRGLGIARQPVRVVLSRKLDLPLDGQLARTAGDVPVWIVHAPDAAPEAVAAWTERGAKCLSAPASGRQIDPMAALQALAGEGLTRVFCEGGGSLAASLLGAGLVDELAVFSAGLTIGAEGMPALAAMGLDRLAEAPRFELKESRPVGADLLQVWRRP